MFDSAILRAVLFRKLPGMCNTAILRAVLLRELPGMFNAAIVPCCTVGELLGIIITVTAALYSTLERAAKDAHTGILPYCTLMELEYCRAIFCESCKGRHIYAGVWAMMVTV
jgi:hypothetical protein